MKVLVTGAGGLIGSEAVRYFHSNGHTVLGWDNNARQRFFGPHGDVTDVMNNLSHLTNVTIDEVDITNMLMIKNTYRSFMPDVIVHCAAQPSHDLAAKIPLLDMQTNVIGTFNMLESVRQSNPTAVFLHVSTNKVYGDNPNRLKLVELPTRWECEQLPEGIDESMSIDNCTHSLFGASKLAGDVYAQEYGRYFGMNVGVFRGGCLTGPQHKGVELHGFLSYIVKCAKERRKYTVFGYKGKQVRDQIHSYDVVRAFDEFIMNPRKGEVYNLGGGRGNDASVIEIMDLLREQHDLHLDYSYDDTNRVGDHIWYVSDMKKFRQHYPKWHITMSIDDIVDEMVNG